MTTQTKELDPKLVQAWEKGARELVRIRGLAKNQATHLRHKLYKIRAAMRRTDHPSAKLAEQVTISMSPNGDAIDPLTKVPTWDLLLFPTNPLDQALSDAGLTAGDPPPLE